MKRRDQIPQFVTPAQAGVPLSSKGREEKRDSRLRGNDEKKENRMHAYRTHTCAELRLANVGETVRLSGWVHRKRDHGHLLFVDLRDHYGITQIVADTDSPAFKTLDRIRVESVVTVEGKVVARSKETVNPNLATGEIEVKAGEVTVQSAAAELPMPVFGDQDYPEEIRLKYRYLDLRREQVHANIMLRSAVIASIRRRRLSITFERSTMLRCIFSRRRSRKR